MARNSSPRRASDKRSTACSRPIRGSPSLRRPAPFVSRCSCRNTPRIRHPAHFAASAPALSQLRSWARSRRASALRHALIKYPSPKEAVAGLQDGAATWHFSASNHRASPWWIFRRRSSSSIIHLSGAGRLHDREPAKTPIGRDVRIGLVDSHASALALRRIVKQAELIGVELPEMRLRSAQRSAKSTRWRFRAISSRFAERLPGARVLAKGYGVNRVALPSQKGSAGLRPICRDFAETAKAIGPAATRHRPRRLRGFDVAAP